MAPEERRAWLDRDRPAAADWPPGVEPIGVDDLRRLGINRANELFWDGRRVEIRRTLVLTGFQKGVAVAVTLCAIMCGLGAFATGINNASIFLCTRNVRWLGCPIPVLAAPPR